MFFMLQGDLGIQVVQAPSFALGFTSVCWDQWGSVLVLVIVARGTYFTCEPLITFPCTKPVNRGSWRSLKLSVLCCVASHCPQRCRKATALFKKNLGGFLTWRFAGSSACFLDPIQPWCSFQRSPEGTLWSVMHSSNFTSQHCAKFHL